LTADLAKRCAENTISKEEEPAADALIAAGCREIKRRHGFGVEAGGSLLPS